MAKVSPKLNVEVEMEDETEDALSALDDLDEDDYIFVVNSQGEMKTVIFPSSDDFEYSKKLLKIFKLLGYNNPDILLQRPTIH
jgi:hypothetical protein